jgi:hypothetical protein
VSRGYRRPRPDRRTPGGSPSGDPEREQRATSTIFLVKSLKAAPIPVDNSKEMGAPAVTTTPFQLHPRQDPPRIRRTRIWFTVGGAVLTLLGGVAVLTIRDGHLPSGILGKNRPASAIRPGDSTAPTVDAPPTIGAPGTAGSPAGGGTPTASTPPPATPQEVAELLAGLPLQLEQAANSGGQPHELTAEEVDKIVDDLLRQLGAKP